MHCHHQCVLCVLGRQAARHKVKVVNSAALSDDEGDEAAAEVANSSQLERWRRVAAAAAKQSLRYATPHIHHTWQQVTHTAWKKQFFSSVKIHAKQSLHDLTRGPLPE